MKKGINLFAASLTLVLLAGFNQSAFSQVTPFSKAVAVNDHQQLFIPMPAQDKAAMDKLAALL